MRPDDKIEKARSLLGQALDVLKRSDSSLSWDEARILQDASEVVSTALGSLNMAADEMKARTP
jgi:hypothetical protein